MGDYPLRLVNCRNIAITLIWPCAGHLSVMAWLRQLRTGITCVESPNWRCEAWQDGVLVLSTPARLELGESVWTLPDSLKLPRLSQPHVLAVQLRFLLGP